MAPARPTTVLLGLLLAVSSACGSSDDTATTAGSGTTTPATTLTDAEDGTLSPTTLSVAVGEALGVTTPVGGGIHAAAVGCADARTVAPGAVRGFQVLVPGTYPVVDETGGETVGTVTVD